MATTYDARWVVSSVVVLVVIGGIFLFAIGQAHSQTLEASQAPIASKTMYVAGSNASGLVTPSVLLGSIGSLGSDEAVLDNDMDHDGNPDGMVDPLVVLAAMVTVVGYYFALLVPLVGRLLPAPCGPLLLVSSECYLPLARPG